MKISRFASLFFLFFLLASLLTACGGGQVVESWHGLSTSTDGTTVYLAGGPQIYAIDPATGAEKPRIPAEANNKITFYSVPLQLEDGSLVAGSYNHSLYRINPANSQAPVWVFSQAKDRYIATPVLAGDTILAPSADNTLYALSLDGKLKWTFQAEHSLWASPVVDNDRIYQASIDHHIYALRLDNGQLIWKTEDLGGELVAQPAFSPEGTLYVGTLGSKTDDAAKGSKLVAISTEDGRQTWSMPTKGWVWATTLVDNILYFGDQEGYIYAIDPQGQKTVWKVQPDTSENRSIVGAPLVTEDTIYIANKAGTLYALDRTSGSQRWMQPIGGQIYASPIAAGDSILVAPMNFDSLVVAVDSNGARRWAFTPAKK